MKNFTTKADTNIFDYIQNQVPTKIVSTVSDIGSLRVGNERFITFINNGCRETMSTVIITENFAHVPLNHHSTVNDKFYIYDFDSGNEVATKLNGKYDIHNGHRITVFNRR